jgi:hypothetical protein
MDYKLLLTVAVLLLWGLSRQAYACSCIPPVPPAEALAQAGAVFSGEVLEVAQDGMHLRVRLQVGTVWKGAGERVVFVTTPASTASCGFPFEQGQEYQVYTTADAESNGLQTNLCTRTKLVSEAAEDLQALGPGTEPRTGGICGGPGSLVVIQAALFSLLGCFILQRRRT